MGQGHDETTPYVPYDFASANNRYTTSPLFTPDPIVGARSRTGIITCCDARCSPEEFFMLPPNEAFVIRNGGGGGAGGGVGVGVDLGVVRGVGEKSRVPHP